MCGLGRVRECQQARSSAGAHVYGFWRDQSSASDVAEIDAGLQISCAQPLTHRPTRTLAPYTHESCLIRLHMQIRKHGAQSLPLTKPHIRTYTLVSSYAANTLERILSIRDPPDAPARNAKLKYACPFLGGPSPLLLSSTVAV